MIHILYVLIPQQSAKRFYQEVVNLPSFQLSSIFFRGNSQKHNAQNFLA